MKIKNILKTLLASFMCFFMVFISISPVLAYNNSYTTKVYEGLKKDYVAMKIREFANISEANLKKAFAEIIKKKLMSKMDIAATIKDEATKYLGKGTKKSNNLKDMGVSGLTDNIVTGSAIKLNDLTVVNKDYSTLKLNKDYTVSYKNNLKVGTATVIFKGKGNFRGTLTKTFNILPNTTWVRYTTSDSTKKIHMHWDEVEGVTGYKIYYSTSSNGTYKLLKTITNKKTLNYISPVLKGSDTYFVKILPYKTIGKNTYISDDSFRRVLMNNATNSFAGVFKKGNYMMYINYNFGGYSVYVNNTKDEGFSVSVSKNEIDGNTIISKIEDVSYSAGYVFLLEKNKILFEHIVNGSITPADNGTYTRV